MMKKFKKQKLTKKQLEIMKILWNSPTPMIASDIEKSNPSLNINTIQACLRALMKAEYIKVADIVYSGTVLTRSYTPCVSKEEHCWIFPLRSLRFIDRRGDGRRRIRAIRTVNC